MWCTFQSSICTCVLFASLVNFSFLDLSPLTITMLLVGIVLGTVCKKFPLITMLPSYERNSLVRLGEHIITVVSYRVYCREMRPQHKFSSVKCPAPFIANEENVRIILQYWMETTLFAKVDTADCLFTTLVI